MLKIVIILILVGLGFYAWKVWKRESSQREAGARDKQPSVSEAGIEQVRAGGMIRLPPHGDDLDTLDVTIKARHVYDEDGFQWYELEGDSDKGTVWLDVCHDDELETGLSRERLGLEDIGLTAEALGKMTHGGKVAHGGQQFSLAEKGRARYRPAGDVAREEALQYWDFEGDDNKHDLGVELWGGEYRVYVSERIDPARIRVYSLGGETP